MALSFGGVGMRALSVRNYVMLIWYSTVLSKE